MQGLGTLDLKFDFTQFNETMRKTAAAFENFGQNFRRSQQLEVMTKKQRKANSRRLRYTLKAHSQ